MKFVSLFALILGLLTFASSNLQATEPLRVITDRTESHLAPMFKHFTDTTGIPVQAVYVKKGMLARIQAQPTEADVVISKAAENLERLRVEGLLQPFSSTELDKVNSQFVDPDKMYLITSYRPRGMFVSKDRVESGSILTYSDLIKPELKGKIAIRSGYHDYNISLFCQMAESEGLEATKKFIAGLKANMARAPKSNDRGQVQAIYDGVADISVGNAYYQGIMMAREDQKPWAESVEVVFANQAGKGAIAMRSGAGMTKSDRNVAAANTLLEYLAGDFAQYYMANSLHVYSINPSIPVGEFNRTLGKNQPEVVDGRFKVNFITVRDADKHREDIIAYLNEINFDSK